ncbi:unnamed protein product [Blepharisma stoltei]|uniref:Uncharacterized protein n=1 Tax=Blepharisma stoltei TaxID=1481888 RepID=A0AAU9IFF3_9CILI|nr:unnamed protein product [Blepharisma stoltei]
MGCGLPSKTFKSKTMHEEEGDTSLQEHFVSSPLINKELKLSSNENGPPFNFEIKGSTYRITVAFISTPDRSNTSN